MKTTARIDMNAKHSDVWTTVAQFSCTHDALTAVKTWEPGPMTAGIRVMARYESKGHVYWLCGYNSALQMTQEQKAADEAANAAAFDARRDRMVMNETHAIALAEDKVFHSPAAHQEA